VLRCVPGQRIVAATDVAARRTPSQVEPPTTRGITLDAANTTGRHRWVDGMHHDCYSHSMVPGGLLVTSSTTRLTSATSLVIRVEIRSSTS
jgi:hypothetical protein